MSINAEELSTKWDQMQQHIEKKQKLVRNYCHEIINQILDNNQFEQSTENIKTDVQKLEIQLMIEEYLQEHQKTIQNMNYRECMKFVLWQIQKKMEDGDSSWQVSQENIAAIKQIIQREKQDELDLLQANKKSSRQYKQLLNLSKEAIFAKAAKKYPINHVNLANSNQYQLSKKHQMRLDIIFQHYCRTDGGRKLQTFEQVKLHFYQMLLHVWMLFCKDFQFIKLPKTRRDDLIEIFKKNATDYREMSRQQFYYALAKIASLAYQDNNHHEDNITLTENQRNVYINPKNVKLLFQYMQIDTTASFTQKARRLNIKYNIRHRTDNQSDIQKSQFMKHSEKFKNVKSKVKIELQRLEKKPKSEQQRNKNSVIKSNSLEKLQKKLIKDRVQKSNSLKRIQIINYRKPVFQEGYLKVFRMKNHMDPSIPQKNKYKLNQIVQQARKQMQYQNPEKFKINEKTFSSILKNQSGVKNQLQQLIKLSKKTNGKKTKIDVNKAAADLVADLIQDDQSEDEFLNALKLQQKK